MSARKDKIPAAVQAMVQEMERAHAPGPDNIAADGVLAEINRLVEAAYCEASKEISLRAASDPPRGDLPEEFDMDALNRRFAFVLIGGTGAVVSVQENADERDRVRIIKESGFKSYLANRFITRRGLDGKPKAISWGEAWWTSPSRRTYEGLIFWPNPDGSAVPSGYLNLWQGFSVESRRGGSYAVLKDHLLTNVAHGDEEVFRWIFGWFAQMVQNPREKPGTAIVLRGSMGAGKTIVGNAIGSLFRPHFFLVDDPRYVTGNFNQHMAQCLLLQAEEAVWAGDKAAEGRLKGLVTSDFQMIEAKGVDPVRLQNFIRILMTSNEDWVVPAGKDERRFAVFDVHPRCAGNHEYFAEMEAELSGGGREALLYDLLHFDLSGINLRTIPKTGALLEQKVRSLDHIETWLLDRLKAGVPTRKHAAWPDFIATEAWFDDYAEASERIGIRRKAAQTAFGMKLRKLLPNLRIERRTISTETGAATERIRGYLLPNLQTCRNTFADHLGQHFDWEADDG